MPRTCVAKIKKQNKVYHYFRPPRRLKNAYNKSTRLSDDYDVAVRQAKRLMDFSPKQKVKKLGSSEKYYASNKVSELFRNAKARAKTRNLEFNITLDYLWEILERQEYRCAVSGMKFSDKKEDHQSKAPFSPSLDRINTKSGYIRGNVRIVSWMANNSMNEFGLEVFLKFARQAVKFNAKSRVNTDM